MKLNKNDHDDQKEQTYTNYVDEDYLNKRMNSIHIREVESKKNSFQKGLFEIFYILLKNESNEKNSSYFLNISLAMFMYFTEFMEFMIFAFQDKYLSLWNRDKIANILSDFWYIPNPIIKVHGATSLVYHIVFYSHCLFVTLMMINIIYIYISIRRNYFSMTWPIFLLNKVCSIVTTVLFFPFLGKFLL